MGAVCLVMVAFLIFRQSEYGGNFLGGETYSSSRSKALLEGENETKSKSGGLFREINKESFYYRCFDLIKEESHSYESKDAVQKVLDLLEGETESGYSSPKYALALHHYKTSLEKSDFDNDSRLFLSLAILLKLEVGSEREIGVFYTKKWHTLSLQDIAATEALYLLGELKAKELDEDSNQFSRRINQEGPRLSEEGEHKRVIEKGMAQLKIL